MAEERSFESIDSKEKDLGGVEGSLDALKYEVNFVNKVDELTKEKDSNPEWVDKFINAELNKQWANAVNAINAIANNFERVVNSVTDKDGLVNNMLDKSGVNAIDRDGLVNNMLDKSGPNTINAIANNFEKVVNSVTDKDGLVNNMLDKSGVNAIDRDGLVNNMLDKSGPNTINAIANNFGKVINSVTDKDGLVNNMLDKSGVNAVDRDGLVNNMLDKSGVNAVNVANVISRNETIVNSISDETKNKLNSYLK